jgi:ABC-2 type transport system ATP-binding protein
MATVIEACQLSKEFPGGVTAVDGLELCVGRGSVYGLMGPNGAGKTTALRLLMGLLRPNRGSARILEQDLWHAPRSLRSRVAYVSQKQQLHSWMTLSELSRYAAHLYERWDAAYARSLSSDWRVNWTQPVGHMSSGDQRKAALVLAFASRPEVLLLDEPASGLDPITRRAVVDEILQIVTSGEGCTVLLSTHLIEDLERIVDYVGIMDQGRLLLSDRLDKLQNSVRRVQVVFQAETVPSGFSIPGALRTETSGPVATALCWLVNEAQLEPIRYLPGVRVQVFPLNLEELFLAFFENGRPIRGLGDSDPVQEPQEQVLDAPRL